MTFEEAVSEQIIEITTRADNAAKQMNAMALIIRNQGDRLALLERRPDPMALIR